MGKILVKEKEYISSHTLITASLKTLLGKTQWEKTKLREKEYSAYGAPPHKGKSREISKASHANLVYQFLER